MAQNASFQSTSSQKQRTWTQSMRHGVAKFFGVDDVDAEKRKQRQDKWETKAQLMHNKSFLLSRKPSRTQPTAAGYEMTAARPKTVAEFARSSKYAAPEMEAGVERPVSTAASYAAPGSGYGGGEDIMDSSGMTTEYTMDTIRPARRMNPDWAKSATVKHDNVFRIMADGFDTLTLRRPQHYPTVPRARSIKPVAIFTAGQTQPREIIDVSFFDESVSTGRKRPSTAAPVPAATAKSRFYKRKGSADGEAGDTDEPDSVPDFAPLLKPLVPRTEKKRPVGRGQSLLIPDRTKVRPPPAPRPATLRAAGTPEGGRDVPEAVGMAGDQPDGKFEEAMTTIKDEFFEEFLDNTNRHELGVGLLGQCFGLKRDIRNQSADIQKQVREIDEKTYRPYFTYWVTFVQIVCFIVSVCVYGFATVGGAMTTITGEVKTSSLSIQQVLYIEDSNFWLGPRQADLIHLGAKYSPCMRLDQNVKDAIENDGRLEANTSCCVLNDGSGCVQTLEKGCSKSLATWMKWTVNSTGPDGRTSGSVCGQDPRFCVKPASTGAFVWQDDLTKWPICEKSSNLTSRSDDLRHMTCPIAGRPCCVGVQGHCVITTREYCDFRRGYFHEEASLCSQVACMSEICGMTPFYYPEKPDQFYRLWISLFIHAGILQLLLTVVFQLVLMRDLEKLLGWLRTCIIYVICGIGGSLASAIFIPYHVEAGPSGSQFGILACMFIEIFVNWRLYEPTSRLWALGWVIFITFFLFAVGLLPMIDNYAHLIGFGLGLLLGFALMPYVTFGDGDKRGKLAGVIICLLLTAGLLAMFILLFYVAKIYDCPGCQYFNCVPLTETFCRSSQVVIVRDNTDY